MYGPIDKQLELRDAADGAVTATTAVAGIAFTVTMAGNFKAVFNVPSLDTTTGNETYRLSIEVGTTTAFASPAEIGAVTVSSLGFYELPLSSWQISQQNATAAAIRCKATLGGTTPSITYGCFLAPSP